MMGNQGILWSGLEGTRSQMLSGILLHKGNPVIPWIFRTEIISCHYDDLLAGHFGINKTVKSVARKYYWLLLKADVKSYISGCDVCIRAKSTCHKPYVNLQSMPIPTHAWKYLSMDFVTRLPMSKD